MVNVTVINIRSIFKLLFIAIVLIFVLGILKFVGGRITLIRTGINMSFVGCINNTLPKIKEDEYTRRN